MTTKLSYQRRRSDHYDPRLTWFCLAVGTLFMFLEGDGLRVRAWTPKGFMRDGEHVAWPWKYVYPDPVAGDTWR